VPKLTVITRKAYGGAYCVMSSKHIRTDLNLAWPTAEIAVMGPEGAVNIVYGRELEQAIKQAEAAEGPLSEERKAELLAAVRSEKVHEFREQFANPYIAAERGYVDAVILPHETRRRLIAALEMLDGKRDKNPPKKHGNIPL
jgi:propionyl-CoA carboxylase beta chain